MNVPFVQGRLRGGVDEPRPLMSINLISYLK